MPPQPPVPPVPPELPEPPEPEVELEVVPDDRVAISPSGDSAAVWTRSSEELCEACCFFAFRSCLLGDVLQEVSQACALQRCLLGNACPSFLVFGFHLESRSARGPGVRCQLSGRGGDGG